MGQVGERFSTNNTQDHGPPSNTQDHGPPSNTQDHGPPSNTQDHGPPSNTQDHGLPSNTQKNKLAALSAERTRETLKRVLTSTLLEVLILVIVLVDTLLVLAQLVMDSNDHLVEQPSVSHALHAVSLTFLSLFSLEVLLKIYAFRWEFLTHKAEVLDAVVVLLALCLDIVFVHHQAGYGFIIILRLWRIFRLCHTMINQTVKIVEA
ncbi:voltage-gated hydrogen channel 1-like [Homarus americanus]|uniref:voltage-gated hydrogen channel 1-like n=1 Tax=Homarus americanus TaxID=6706 RepID=UPI001C4570AF|nr:voltage-gated hydrogen channel 1-like [Homarus americanus]